MTLQDIFELAKILCNIYPIRKYIGRSSLILKIMYRINVFITL